MPSYSIQMTTNNKSRAGMISQNGSSISQTQRGVMDKINITDPYHLSVNPPIALNPKVIKPPKPSAFTLEDPMRGQQRELSINEIEGQLRQF